MNGSFERVSLPLESAFRISRGTQTVAENVVVRLEHDGHVGVGSAAPARHYGETVDTVEAVLADLVDAVDGEDPFQVERLERRLRETVRGNPAARAGVSIALHDLVGKLLDVPLYRYFGLDPEEAVATSYTVGIDDTDAMVESAADAVRAGHSVLKLKLGTDRDVEIVRRVRETASDVAVRVDANEAWGPKEAVRKCEALAAYDVEFVEQPVPAERPETLAFVHDRSPLPIAADESLVDASDVPRVADRADVANLKLMKCGGLTEARRIIHAAEAYGLDVMCGCMVESAASIAAAAHLAPALDYADLDGSLLLAEDPFEGPVQSDGTIDLAETPGTGVGEV